MANYDAISKLLAYMDTVSTEFVAQNLSAITLAVTPLVAIGLTMSLMISGLHTMASGDGEPLSELVSRFFRYALIISFASAGGWFQKDLANLALKAPDEFANMLVVGGSAPPTQETMGNTIDSALDKGITISKQAFKNAGISGSGIASALLGMWSMFVTVIMCGVGAAFILAAKFWMSITVCFGPIFLYMLLWEATRQMFDKWIGSVITYGLTIILVASVFGLMIKFYEKALASAMTGTGSDIVTTMVTAGVITVVSMYVLLQIPEKAALWGSGITVAARTAMRGGPGRSAAPQGGGKGGGGGEKEKPDPAPSEAETPPSGAGAAGKSGAGDTKGSGSQIGSAMQGMAKGSRR
ncbi:type IV secretion system protein [Pseudomonas sp. Marseille-Q5115]|uniref:type IV secretion system protein n=1 Tax=Pseudomonas sp. Marseille-Q5115 TaxID=2866593 RepID=UPI001CE3FE3F|nr:type IV secretion system protein [Pseudomonas sp. Marseille-Q5115]